MRSGGGGTSEFVLKGRVIDPRNTPMPGVRVLAFDDDPWINPDDFLGEAATNGNGRFEIEFDRSKFAPVWEFLEGSPDVYLVLRDQKRREILRTRVQQTKKEIEYHVKIAPHFPEPDAKDIYAANPRRLLNMLGEVGNIVGLENTLNLDVLANGDLPTEVRGRLEGLAEGFDDRISNFNHLMAALNGLINATLEERRLGTIGYDGPQVPRLPRREAYFQVIIWPRQESFRWG